MTSDRNTVPAFIVRNPPQIYIRLPITYCV